MLLTFLSSIAIDFCPFDFLHDRLMIVTPLQSRSTFIPKCCILNGNLFQLYCATKGSEIYLAYCSRSLTSRSNTMHNKTVMASSEAFFNCIDCSKVQRHVSKVQGSLEAST